MRSTVRAITLAAAALALGANDTADDPLVAGFRDPPAPARPRVWWHWMNGNVTEEGIALDLAWFDRIGIAGFQMLEGDTGVPVVVPRRIAHRSAAWRSAVRAAARGAQQHGLEMAVATAPGWSATGGPGSNPRTP